MKPVRLMRGFLTVGGWTLASRLLGFVRDILLAAFLGAGPVADAFLVAFALPNMFRRFFAEGAFNMAFIPMFAKKLEAGEDPKAFAEEALAALGSILIGLVLLAQIGMPWLVLAMASGFKGDERFDLAVTFGRIAFPYVLFISFAALFSGVLNATGKFAAAAAAPVLLNVTLSGAMLWAHYAGRDVALALTWGVPIAGIAQLALVWWAASRAGFALRPKLPRFTPEMRRLAMIAAPAALAGGVVQVNLLVGRQVASFFEGSIQYLNLADRLYQLPLGVVAIAIGVVLLPDLSRRLRAGDASGGRYAFNRAFEFALLLTVPAAVALVVIPETLISTLFQRGKFTPEDARATGYIVLIYGLGLPAFVIQKVLQPVYFAREDTRSPFRYALAAMAINAVLAIGLSPWIGYYAAAVGATAAGWGMVWLLWRGARKMGDAARPDERLIARSGRILLASLAMGGLLYAMREAMEPAFAAGGGTRALALLVLVVIAMVAYFAIAQAIGAVKLADIRSSMGRKGG